MKSASGTPETSPILFPDRLSCPQSPSALHSILKPHQRRPVTKTVTFIDRVKGLPLAEVHEVEHFDVETTQKSSCCALF
jgi:hypothetical protein